MKQLYICVSLLLLSHVGMAQVPTIACSSVCPGGTINLTDVPTDTNFFCTSDGINVSGTIIENQEATFQAGSRILFKPGFGAKKGSTVHAMTDNCEEIVEIAERSAEIADFSFAIAPNPVFHEGHIAIALPEASEISITLSSIDGRVVHTLVHRKLYKQGDYRFHLDVNQFPVGVYFAALHVYGEIHTKRLIVAK